MDANIYVIEKTVTTQEWFYKGEQVSGEVIMHVCHTRGTTTVPDDFLTHFPDVEVKNVARLAFVFVFVFVFGCCSSC